MILWLAVGCARPPPPAAPLRVPVEQSQGIDGWSLLQADGAQWWTELGGPAASAIAAEASSEARPSWGAPPEDPEPELARRALAVVGGRARPAAYALSQSPGALEPVSPELVAAEPTPSGGIRLWFRPLGPDPTSLAIADWSDSAERPVGLQARPAGARVRLALEEGTLVATQSRAGPEDEPLDCTTAALHFDHGGIRWFGEGCRDADAAPGAAMAGSLPIAWFARAGERWLVVNRFEGGIHTRCLARFPAADEPIRPTACVSAPPEPRAP